MAQTLENIRALIRTSLHGRRIGLTALNDDYLGGPKEFIRTVQNATSATTGTAINPYGLVTVQSPSSKNWKLTDPAHPGIVVRFVTNTTSTKVQKVTPVAATIHSTNGLAGSSFTMKGAGAYLELTSLTTALWAVTSRYFSTSAAGVSVVVSS